MLFLHYGLRFSADLLIGSAYSQRIHAVLEHPAADSQQIGGMGLDVVSSFEESPAIEGDSPLYEIPCVELG